MVQLSGLGGGAADKRGNRYESWWTISRLLDLVEGTVDLMRLEPPGDEGVGAEHWVESGGVRCYDQAKDVPSGGNWSPHVLAIGPLAKLRPHLVAGHRVKLILSTPATGFEALIRVANAAVSRERFFDLLTKEQKVSFDKVSRALECDADTAIGYLRRSTVEVWSREALHDRVGRQAAFTFAGDRDATIDFLTGFITEHLHQTVSSLDVLDFLEQRGVRRNLLAGDPTTLETYRSIGRRFARSIRSTAKVDRVDRPELDDLVTLLSDPETPQVVVVDGGAGSGKSSLVADAMVRLDGMGWATCGVRMDRVPPTTLTAGALGTYLGLTASPGLVAASTARIVPTLLVIDQLDAVSEFSGRLSQPFEAVTEILEELALGPAAKVVLVVRTIDLKNDARIASLVRDEQRATRFELGTFNDGQLAAGLTSLGLSPAVIDSDMKELLRVPLHFAVFSQLSPSARTGRFASLPQLYLMYTEEIRRQIEIRSPNFEWDAAVSPIVRYVSDNETLAVPLLALAGGPAGGIAQLESHGVVVNDDDHVGFFHETYFDFLFAVEFLRTGQDLLEFIVGSGQQLFRRAQVRQILVHLEGVSPRRFAAEVRRILVDGRVRSHLKDVVISVVGLVGASERNWRELEDIVLGEGWVAQHLRVSLASPTWFDAIDAADCWPSLLADGDLSPRSRSLLIGCAQWRPIRAAELVCPHVGASEEWRDDIALMVERSLCADLVPFVIRLLEAGELDGASSKWRGGPGLWSLAEELSREHPVEAAQVLAAYLQRSLDRATAAGSGDPFESGGLAADSRGNHTVLEDLAAAAPGPLIDAVLPLVVAVSEATAIDDGDNLRVVPRWKYRHRGPQYSVDRALIQALDTSFVNLAGTQSDHLGLIARSLGSSDIEVLRFLACRAFAAAGSAADEAIGWLVSDTANLSLGWSGSHAWATRELIEAAAARCSETTLDDLARRLLDHWPAWEFPKDRDLRIVGASQQSLLSAIPAPRRSRAVSKRLAELDRKFNRTVFSPPDERAIASFVGPPIPADAARHMSDSDWRRAIAKWNDDQTNWSEFPPTGGARALASVLQTRAEAEPQRFAALAMTFDASVHSAYAEAVIRGTSPSLDTSARSALLTRLADVFGPAVGRTVCSAIDETAEEANEVIISLIARYATDPDPVEDAERFPDPGGSAFQLESAALNSTRGAVARACASLLFAGDTHIERLRMVINDLVADSTMAVRAAASSAVLALSNYDRPTAQTQVDRLLDHPDIDIYDSDMIENMLTYAAMWDPERTAPYIERALAGPPHVSRHGGFTWAVLSNRGELPQSLARDVSQLSPSARVGAASLMASWVDGDPESLCTLLRDPDPLVAKEASSFLEHLDGLPTAITEMILETFVDSAAFPEHLEQAMRQLTRLPQTSTAVSLAMCERAIELADQVDNDMQSTWFAASSAILATVVREYRRCPDGERDRCLDIIDRLCQLRVFGLDDALSHTRSS